MAKPSLDEIFASAPSEATTPQGESLDAIFSQQEQPQASGGSAIADTALVAGGALGAGALANKFVVQPMIEKNAAKNELTKLRQSVGIDPKTSFERTIKVLDEMEGRSMLDIEKRLNGIDAEAKTIPAMLKAEANNIKNSVGSKFSSDLAEKMVADYYNIKKSASKKYGDMFDMINAKAEQAGYNVHAGNFANSVLDDVISYAEEFAPNEKITKNLIRERDRLLGETAVDKATGANKYVSISPSKAKSVIDNIIGNEWASKVATKLRGSFSQFLSDNAPIEVKGLYNTLQSDYKDYAEWSNTIDDYHKRDTGRFNTKGLKSFIESTIGERGDIGIKKQLEFLTKGNTIVPANPDYAVHLAEHNSLSDRLQNIAKHQDQFAITLPQKREEVLNEANALSRKFADIKSNAGLLLDRMGKKAIGVGDVVKTGVKMAVPMAGRFMAAMPMGVVQGNVEKNVLGGVDMPQALGAFSMGMFGSPQQKEQAAKEAFRQWQEASAI